MHYHSHTSLTMLSLTFCSPQNLFLFYRYLPLNCCVLLMFLLTIPVSSLSAFTPFGSLLTISYPLNFSVLSPQTFDLRIQFLLILHGNNHSLQNIISYNKFSSSLLFIRLIISLRVLQVFDFRQVDSHGVSGVSVVFQTDYII
jgi:hypothetical protein